MPLAATLLLGLTTMSSFGTPTVTPFAEGKKAAFSLEFDDSMVSQIKNVLPLLAQYKFPATFYINPGRNDYQAEIWEKQVPKAGHELADHTLHHGDTVGAEQGEQEIGSVAKIIEKIVGHPTLTVFGTPGGVKWEIPKDDFERILKKYDLIFPGRQDFYQDGQGDIRRFPKRALDEGIWRQLGFHGVGGQWLSTSVENLTSVLQFLDAHRSEMWVAPTGTVYKYVQERAALKAIDLHPHGDRSFVLTQTYDPVLQPFSLYDVPLTVRVPVPTDWKAATVTIGGRRRRVVVEKGLLQFEVVPQVKSVGVSKA